MLFEFAERDYGVEYAQKMRSEYTNMGAEQQRTYIQQ